MIAISQLTCVPVSVIIQYRYVLRAHAKPRQSMAQSTCLLEWWPWSHDRVMGLNHQMAALSCALSEAFFLNRTLLFPSHLCLNSMHELRWRAGAAGDSAPGAANGNMSARCQHRDARGVTARGFAVPVSSVLDVHALRGLVPIELVRLDERSARSEARGDATKPPRRHALETSVPAASSIVVDVDRSWTSERIGAQLPCARAAHVRRRVSGFWFRPCSYGIANCNALASALDAAVGARGALRRRKGSALVPHMLRSGLFYAPHVREAANAVRLAIGGPYAAVHVRRSDRVTTECLHECARAEALTRPDALLRALRGWYRPGTRLYIGSTEPPAYFDSLRAHFRVTMAEDFASSALSRIPHNYALYAVETLVFFGANSMVETFGYSSSWLSHACFPAAALRHTSTARAVASARASDASHTVPTRGISIQCVDAHSVLANGVYYGPACVSNPPCGDAMSLVPDGTSTSTARTRSAGGDGSGAMRSGTRASVSTASGCGATLNLLDGVEQRDGTCTRLASAIPSTA